jgi:hypothetical protein
VQDFPQMIIAATFDVEIEARLCHRKALGGLQDLNTLEKAVPLSVLVLNKIWTESHTTHHRHLCCSLLLCSLVYGCQLRELICFPAQNGVFFKGRGAQHAAETKNKSERREVSKNEERKEGRGKDQKKAKDFIQTQLSWLISPLISLCTCVPLICALSQ